MLLFPIRVHLCLGLVLLSDSITTIKKIKVDSFQDSKKHEKVPHLNLGLSIDLVTSFICVFDKDRRFLSYTQNFF